MHRSANRQGNGVTVCGTVYRPVSLASQIRRGRRQDSASRPYRLLDLTAYSTLWLTRTVYETKSYSPKNWSVGCAGVSLRVSVSYIPIVHGGPQPKCQKKGKMPATTHQSSGSFSVSGVMWLNHSRNRGPASTRSELNLANSSSSPRAATACHAGSGSHGSELSSTFCSKTRRYRGQCGDNKEVWE